MLGRAIVFCSVISVALAAVAIAPLETKPDKYKDVKGCYIGELDAMILIGQTKPSTESCMQYRCYENHVTYESCGVVATSSCELVEHLEEPYPDCCPKVECPEAVNE